MLIRADYEIAYECPRPTPMVLMLSLHPSRLDDLAGPAVMVLDPPMPVQHYRDLYGNVCSRIAAPAGPVTISSDFVINDSGLPDEVAPEAEQIPVEKLPDDVLVYLLGSRYCDTDHLSNLAWSLFSEGPTGWARVQAICDYVNSRLTFGYQHASATRTAWEGFREQRGVCRDFAHLAITLCRCMNIPAALLHRLSGRYRRAAGAGANGLQRLVRNLPQRALAHLRCAPQHAPHRPHPDGARTRRHRRGALDKLRPHAAGEVQRRDGRGGGLIDRRPAPSPPRLRFLVTVVARDPPSDAIRLKGRVMTV
jgi:transglutaminase-like putative cysteine protease